MFRKVISVIVLSLYTAFGAIGSISWHYCHQNLVDVSFNTQAESCCDDGIVKSDCCSDITFEYDLDENQVITQYQLHAIDYEMLMLSASQSLYASFNSSNESDIQTNYFGSPPDLPNTDIILLNQSFLFYS